VSAQGNFEGKNILHVARAPAEVAAHHGMTAHALEALASDARRVLYAARELRVHPGRDEKILAAWNGLVVRALADGARAFGDAEWRSAAVRHGDFLFREMVRDGRVMRVHRDGVTKGAGFLEDYAAVALAAVALYELTLDVVWLERAESVRSQMVRWFWDDGIGGFFDTAHDHEALIARPRELTDNAVPAGNSLAAELLLRLGAVQVNADELRRGTWVVETLGEAMYRYPTAFGHALGAAELAVHGALEVAITGVPGTPDFDALLRETGDRYLPSLVLAAGTARGVALLEGRGTLDGRALAYVCRGNVCDAPETDAGELAGALERAAGELSA
jgi:hypothetical protein